VILFTDAPSVVNVTSGLSVDIIEAPTEDLTTLQAHIIGRWSTYIQAWAILHLCSMPGKPWYDPTQAAQADRTFWRGVAYARREKHIQGTARTMTMQATSFLDR
jgi:hypothetical protein